MHGLGFPYLYHISLWRPPSNPLVSANSLISKSKRMGSNSTDFQAKPCKNSSKKEMSFEDEKETDNFEL